MIYDTIYDMMYFVIFLLSMLHHSEVILHAIMQQVVILGYS